MAKVKTIKKRKPAPKSKTLKKAEVAKAPDETENSSPVCYANQKQFREGFED